MFRYVLVVAVASLVFLSARGLQAAEKNPVVTVDTSMGAFDIELLPDKAPITVQNFLSYVKDKFYDGTLFHRVINGFMLQGGGFTPDGKRKETKPPIKNEAANGLLNDNGTIAMARTGDPNSATSQFFVNVKDNEFLNHKNDTPQGIGYCVFGKVVSGMDVVNKIKEVPVTRGTLSEAVPNTPIIIKSITEKK